MFCFFKNHLKVADTLTLVKASAVSSKNKTLPYITKILLLLNQRGLSACTHQGPIKGKQEFAAKKVKVYI